MGDSTGGGMVETVSLDGFPVRTIGDSHLLLVQDPHQTLSADDLERVRAELPEALSARTVPAEGRGVLYVYELSVEPDVAAVREALGAAAATVRVTLLRPLLPVVSQSDRSRSSSTA